MFFGGGFEGFGHPGMSREVDNSEFYELLGISKSATASEIKKAYRKLAIKHHPDKGGNPETFKKISEAYDCLGNPEKKEVYDKYGKEGLEQGGGMSSAEDVFSQFFGGGGKKRNQGPAKSKDLVHQLDVTLEELFNGKKRKLSVARKRAVYPEGMRREDAVQVCSICDGRGFTMKVRRMGPMIQQMQAPCDHCGGTGKIYKKGIEVKKLKKVLEVYIEPGMRDKEKIVFSGESDELPGMLAGDIIIVLNLKKHNVFQRRGADLFLQMQISLKQALTGFEIPINHLDGKTLVIKQKPNEVITDHDLRGIPDQGMPIYKRPFEHGRLFVYFQVEFPKTLSEKQRELIKSALPSSRLDSKRAKYNKDDENVEVVENLIKMTEDDIGKVKAAAATAQAYDSDDDEGHQGRGVQCQQS